MATDDDAYDHDHADYHADDNDGHAEEQGRGRLHDGDMKRKLEVQAGTIAAFMKPSFWVVLYRLQIFLWIRWYRAPFCFPCHLGVLFPIFLQQYLKSNTSLL